MIDILLSFSFPIFIILNPIARQGKRRFLWVRILPFQLEKQEAPKGQGRAICIGYCIVFTILTRIGFTIGIVIFPIQYNITIFLQKKVDHLGRSKTLVKYKSRGRQEQLK